ncbi:MAG TPA: hypothetical protein PKJ55_00840 [Novosphingobium sp.]|nr:hypothetical protein [Novosphingobium sp.]
MRRLLPALAIATLAVPLHAAGKTAAPAALPPGVPSADAIVGHVRDCMAASGTPSPSFSVLTQRGWQQGSITTPDGKPQPAALFSKPSDMTMLVVFQQGPNAGRCMVMSPVVDLAGDQAVRARMATLLGKPLVSADGLKQAWKTATQTVVLEPMGTEKARGVRIAVKFTEGR